ncbi:hypothetical protein TNCV_4587551 [Trichonephila clavipes]|uniref:Uncharacterized protein n=1 Tax=Trichonephila clavipes TaxID=2585209 RepID=A0A8X6V8E8_TRICX|nr:hypothetical protein TNCV_4587551 [Trichonephila clavipes]
MTTTSYRSHSAVGVRHLFPSRQYSAVRSCLVARGTMTTTFLPRTRGGGCSSPFSVEELFCCPFVCCCWRNYDNDILPRTRDVGFSYPFFVDTLTCCPVASWCTRNDDKYILLQPLGGGCSSPFSVEELLWCPVASWSTQNDGNDILPQALSGGCSFLFPSRQYSGVRLRLVARGTITTTSYRSRSAEGVRHFFRRGTTLLSDRVLVHAERCQLYATGPRGAGLFVKFFRPGTTQLSGRVLMHAER